MVNSYSYELDADLPHILLSYGRQIASGMSYVAAKALSTETWQLGIFWYLNKVFARLENVR